VTRYHLTFDIDWAPDWSIRESLQILAEHDARATFFVTHPTPVIEEIRAAGHDLGLHPNFLAGSTQGDTPVDIIRNLLELVPEASAIRTHALHQSSMLFLRLAREFPQLRYDLSILMYKFRHIEWFDWRLSGSHLHRINYNWEDDVAFYDEDLRWDRFDPFAELTIFDFHPIHVSLNAAGEQPYLDLKQQLGSRPLVDATQDEVLRAVHDGAGTRDYLRAILASDAERLAFGDLLCALD
jgi:hypothetical protein